MNQWSQSERVALGLALGLHVMLGVFLALDPHSHARPVLTKETVNEQGEQVAIDQKQSVDIVKATTVDQQAVMETIEKLKQAKQQAQQKEQAEKQAVQAQLQQAKQARLAEQQHLQALKVEEEKIAIAHKKALEEEKKRLAQLADQKEKEKKALEALKAKQVLMKAEQARIQKEQAQQQQKALAAEQKEKEHQNKLAEAKRQQEAQRVAAADAVKRARIAGEVDKYKALILNAISRQWILPESVRPGLSSQFRIRLASNGAVLEVTLIRSSGDPILDHSAQTAIYKASPLPVPADAETFGMFRDISLTVRPENLRG